MFRRGFLGLLLGGMAGFLSWAFGGRPSLTKLPGSTVINYGPFADMSGRRQYHDHRGLPHISYRGSAWVTGPEFVDQIELPAVESGYQRVSIAFHPLTGRPVPDEPKPEAYWRDDHKPSRYEKSKLERDIATWTAQRTWPRLITWHVHDASDLAVEAEQASLAPGAAIWAQTDKYLATIDG